MKIKWDSKSPKNRSHTPTPKETSNPNKLSKEILEHNIHSARNIEDVKKKLQSYKVPMRLNNKYFKKDLNINEKL